jgi:hypothetical protein
MRRDLPICSDYDEDFFDDFGEFEEFDDDNDAARPEETKTTPIHSENWTIVDAFNTINDELPKSQLGSYLMIRCAEAFDFLSNMFGFNPVQCVVIAMLVENGQAMSFRNMGKVLGLSRLSMMTHYNDIEALFKARWLIHCGAMEPDGIYDGYHLARGVVSAIRENRPFVPEILECNDTQEFVEKLSAHIAKGYNDNNLIFADEKFWIKELINANKELPVCKMALSLEEADSMSLLMLVIADYCNFNGTKDEGIGPRDVQLVYPRETTLNYRRIVSKIQNGTHELFLKKLIEHKCEGGLADVNTYVATTYLKNEILGDFCPSDHRNKQIPKMNGLIASDSIKAKKLYYNANENEQVNRLLNLLSPEQLPQVQDRLAKKGMRTGVCILMHGGPGTGKTATAFELARQTGRDIIQVQVTDFKDKYVGESETKLKNIFNNYRTCCKNSKSIPILLLNEGDAILSKRTTNVEKSVDQMANSLQNILLEEMENLEGIMIVTTNLITNLDSAFERRFIFKIQFDKPSKNVKAMIWKSLIEELDEEDSMKLAEAYDISGGEIENIARKTIMEYALTGLEPDLNMVKNFAKEEKLKTNTRPVVGFNTRFQ